MDLHKIMFRPYSDLLEDLQTVSHSISIGSPNTNIEADWAGVVDWASLQQETTRRLQEIERWIRMDLLAGEPINGDVLDYRVELLDGYATSIACAHYPSSLPPEYYRGEPIPASARIESRFHAVELRPVPWDNHRGFGVCHDKKVIFVTGQGEFTPRGGDRVEIQKPPIGPKDCTFCGARELESFLKAEGKVVCHPCVEKLPTCSFCSNKVMANHSYKSKVRDAVACPPCMEERKGLRLAKEVPK